MYLDFKDKWNNFLDFGESLRILSIFPGLCLNFVRSHSERFPYSNSASLFKLSEFNHFHFFLNIFHCVHFPLRRECASCSYKRASIALGHICVPENWRKFSEKGTQVAPRRLLYFTIQTPSAVLFATFSSSSPTPYIALLNFYNWL